MQHIHFSHGRLKMRVCLMSETAAIIGSSDVKRHY